jgi:TRAP-type mannitol/chloroaromatic compound transport system permease small subunit
METSFSAWNPPVWPIKAAIPVGTALLLLQGIAKLFEDIAIATGRKTNDHRPPRGEHK